MYEQCWFTVYRGKDREERIGMKIFEANTPGIHKVQRNNKVSHGINIVLTGRRFKCITC